MLRPPQRTAIPRVWDAGFSMRSIAVIGRNAPVWSPAMARPAMNIGRLAAAAWSITPAASSKPNACKKRRVEDTEHLGAELLIPGAAAVMGRCGTVCFILMTDSNESWPVTITVDGIYSADTCTKTFFGGVLPARESLIPSNDLVVYPPINAHMLLAVASRRQSQHIVESVDATNFTAPPAWLSRCLLSTSFVPRLTKTSSSITILADEARRTLQQASTATPKRLSNGRLTARSHLH
ncbi:hypothetical protein DOTSEDRAFT_33997 [Dothistroma septosporum NZE10]|uniref:Uncharacterized protein n=1 Tax=Dothistroma septosporum (strain NZE10 / CBS 128990) TaxID=675120 RepID=N1PT09_DOTSN|nr:hypothetical protein DOTSEDRAFT_33997 [Dothistroma septosporum NZE10]